MRSRASKAGPKARGARSKAGRAATGPAKGAGAKPKPKPKPKKATAQAARPVRPAKKTKPSAAPSTRTAKSPASPATKRPAASGDGAAPKAKGKKRLPGPPEVRAPARAEELKDKLGRLASARGRIRTLKRSLERSFFEIGLILADLEAQKLHEAKGYGAFDAFIERETDIGKQLGLELLAIVRTFQREAALEAGLERVRAGLAALRGDEEDGDRAGFLGRSPIPPHKR